jgi:hypothetical protein
MMKMFSIILDETIVKEMDSIIAKANADSMWNPALCNKQGRVTYASLIRCGLALLIDALREE